MLLQRKNTEDNKKKKRVAELLAGLGTVFFMALSLNMTSYAFVRPNSIGEVEPNNTREEAQFTTQNNEVAEKIADSNWSGSYYVYGTADATDDDWYKVVLTAGKQYLTVAHVYGDNATYVELYDSENNPIIPKKYGTRYNVIQFDSNGGTYYIHITGALETESRYTLYVGTPVHASESVNITFDGSKTSGTVERSFSLENESILPKDAVVGRISFDGMAGWFSSVRITNSGYSGSLSCSGSSDLNNIGSLGIKLKSEWKMVFYPKKTVDHVPMVTFNYVFPVYDNTVYSHWPTIKK